MTYRYRFVGKSGTRLYWEARIPGDSRVDQISCEADWWHKQCVDPEPVDEHFPWHYTAFGVVCACGASMRDGVCPSDPIGVPK